MANQKMKLKLDYVTLIDQVESDRARRRAMKQVFRENPSARTELGLRAVDTIIERTESGKDISGSSFKEKYSKGYKDSAVFSIYGKSKSTVDLKLTGSMHADLGILSSNDRSVTIGYEDNTEFLKARRHNNGLKGMPKREFFGLTDKEKKDIIKSIIKDFRQPIFEEATRQVIAESASIEIENQSNEINFDEFGDF